jgi:hypothetical protein
MKRVPNRHMVDRAGACSDLSCDLCWEWGPDENTPVPLFNRRSGAQAPAPEPAVQQWPTAQLVMPTGTAERNEIPLCTGLLDYFALALAEVAKLSKTANDQHNPGEPMHWAVGKSTDHADKIMKHLVDRGLKDTDGMRHSAKVVWRALAMLTEELVAEGGKHARGVW